MEVKKPHMMATEVKAPEDREVAEEGQEAEQEDQEEEEVATEETIETTRFSTKVVVTPKIKKAVRIKSLRKNSNSWKMQFKSIEMSSKEYVM